MTRLEQISVELRLTEIEEQNYREERSRKKAEVQALTGMIANKRAHRRILLQEISRIHLVCTPKSQP